MKGTARACGSIQPGSWMADNFSMDAAGLHISAPIRGAGVEVGTTRTVSKTESGLRQRLGCWGVVLLLGLGASGLRLVNLDYASFTHTEAWRANWTHLGTIDQARRFPPMQFVLGNVIQRTLGRDEFWLRMPYALAGVACVLAVYGVARRALGGEAALLAGALAAAHPVLVYYSRRQLEYSMEACASAILLWMGYEAFLEPTRRRLLMFGGCGLLALGFTFTGALWMAAWAPCLMWAMWSANRQAHQGSPPPEGGLGKKHAFASSKLLFAVLGAWLVVGGAWVYWFLGFPGRGELSRYYDEVEVVWPVAYTVQGLAEWGAGALYGTMHFVLGMSDIWQPLNWFLGTLYLLCIFAAHGLFSHRSRILVVVLGLVGLEVLVAGALRLWPFGDIRHSTFLIPPAMIVVGGGLEVLRRKLGRSVVAAVLIGACVLLPMVRAARATIVSPPSEEHSRPVFEYVAEHGRPGDGVFLYYFARDAFEFYRDRISLPVFVEPSTHRGQVDAFGADFAVWMAQHRRVWFVFAHNWKNERNEWLGYLAQHYSIVDSLELRDASVHLVVPRESLSASPLGE